MDEHAVIEATRRWISSLVIGLNLCPFAQRVFNAGTIRYVVSETADEATLLEDLARELEFLAASPISTVETTLLIHPNLLGDFLDYNDFLDPAEQLIEKLGLQGIIQLASFHPHYQFAGTATDAVENYTNRSPYPMLHLLREESITSAAADQDALAEIPRRNVETLRALGREWVLEKLKEIDQRRVPGVPDGDVTRRA
jgi:uncharacterized protein